MLARACNLAYHILGPEAVDRFFPEPLSEARLVVATLVALQDEIDEREARENAQKGMIWARKNIKEALERDVPKLLAFHPPSVLERRVLTTREEIDTLQQLCLNVLNNSERTLKALQVMQEFIRFCQLLRMPENFVMGPTGVYQEKPVLQRPIRDMEAEKAQELMNLPPRIAYVRAIEENEGEHRIVKRKIRTLELAPERSDVERMEQLIRNNTIARGYVRDRHRVAEEMHRRQTEWRERRVEKPADRKRRSSAPTRKRSSSKPPPAWE